jgi:hypothetical protein
LSSVTGTALTVAAEPEPAGEAFAASLFLQAESAELTRTKSSAAGATKPETNDERCFMAYLK